MPLLDSTKYPKTYLPALLLPEGSVKGPCACGGVQDKKHGLGVPPAAGDLLLHPNDGAGVALVLQVQRGLVCMATRNSDIRPRKQGSLMRYTSPCK